MCMLEAVLCKAAAPLQHRCDSKNTSAVLIRWCYLPISSCTIRLRKTFLMSAASWQTSLRNLLTAAAGHNPSQTRSLPTLFPHPSYSVTFCNEAFFEQTPPPQSGDILPCLALAHMKHLSSSVPSNAVLCAFALQHPERPIGVTVYAGHCSS